MFASKFWAFFRNIHKNEKLKTSKISKPKYWDKILKQYAKKHRFVKVKNSLLQIENDFEVVKDGKLKKRNRRTIF